MQVFRFTPRSVLPRFTLISHNNYTAHNRCSTWQGLASLSGIPKAALPIAVVFKYTLDTPIDASSEERKVAAYLSRPGHLTQTSLDIFG